jgi:chromosome segregation ATPase
MCDATAKITYKSQRRNITVDLAPVILGVLLAVTAVASVMYSRQIRKAQKEYEKARGLVEDIVLSFNRQLRRESDKFESVAVNVENSLSKADTSLDKIEGLEKKVAPLEIQLSSFSQTVTENNTSLQTLQSGLSGLTGLTGLELKIKDIEASQETLKTKIAGFEEQIQKLATATPEIRTEMPVMPLKRDKALASLTDTEISVLEMLSKEGAKTAPEIKERVQLSREHTARLMKKLYEEGYVERETGKIPFRYSAKREMQGLMENTVPKPQQ